MNFLEQLFTVWRALLANKLRSFLTLLGVIMGVGTIVVLSGVMGGGLAAIKRSVDQARGEDLINVSIKQRNEEGKRNPKLKMADMEALSRSTGLQKATIVPQLEEWLPLSGASEAKRTDARVVGANPGALSLYQLDLGGGRFISSLDRDDSRRVVVLGRDIATKLFGTEKAIGQEMHVAGKRFRVIGVLGSKPSLNVGNRTWNQSVIIPDTTLLGLQGKRELEAILIKTNATERITVNLGLFDKSIRAILEARSIKGKTLDIQSALTQEAGEQGFLQALRILLYAVAFICMGVGGINIMNIMLVTVSERTREIGLRLAIGAQARDIRRQFIFEAAALSALGGLLGVVGGIGLSWIVSLVLSQVLGFWPFMVDWVAVSIAFSSALIVGVVFGWYPASQAASLQPIECLRYE